MGPKQIQLQKVDIPFTQLIIALSLKQDNLKNTLQNVIVSYFKAIVTFELSNVSNGI